MYLSFSVNGLIHEFMWQLRISRQAKVISGVSNKGKNYQLSLQNVLSVAKKIMDESRSALQTLNFYF